MRCRLCGYEFDAAQMACHAACPLGSRCNLICCPNCGYQVVDESRSWLVSSLRRIWPSLGRPDEPPRPPQRRPAGASVPLSHIPVGVPVEVQSLEDMPAQRLARLSLYGLTPGSYVEIVQHRPLPVVRVGETELSLDKEILAQIWVQPHTQLLT
ncbi:MAG TPA: ferrous iron transport protein A [Caldilineaceae bacterium]|nr:ferrous iron transport protein A [Caldilineaceae bacterium]